MWLFFFRVYSWAIYTRELNIQLVLRHSCAEIFSSYQFFIFSPVFWQIVLFFIVRQPYFLGVVRNQVSLRYPNRNLHIRTYRGILCKYLWYSKKKGVNVGNPRHKNTMLDQFCFATTGAFWPNVPTFGCRGDMLPTCQWFSQPSWHTLSKLGCGIQPCTWKNIPASPPQCICYRKFAQIPLLLRFEFYLAYRQILRFWNSSFIKQYFILTQKFHLFL